LVDEKYFYARIWEDPGSPHKLGNIIVVVMVTKIVYILRFATMHRSGMWWRRSGVVRFIIRVKRDCFIKDRLIDWASRK